jgi:serine protease
MKRAIAIALLCAMALPAAAEQISGIIVKLKPSAGKASMAPTSRLARVADGAGVPLQYVRTLATGAQLAALPGPVDAAQARAAAARIAADPDVEYAEPNWRAHAAAIANDEFFVSQGYLTNGVSSISAATAWDTTKGSPNVVVAVIDTGVRPHVDLAGRLLPGSDMVSPLQGANDGDGRDADASDPGDWVSPGESVDGNTDCVAHTSVWHGTSVSGIIASVTNDRVWTAGIDWYARILPVRVLGKCGGTVADIADGIAWAGGVRVPGVPVNATPAQVLNLSLGGDHECPRAYIDAINAAYARGFTRAIVVAAGNASADVAGTSPANCPGVVSVASTTSQGNLARYSNFGAVTLSAPGGQLTARFTTEGIVVLSNQGTTVPAADGFDIGGGTSFAAPMVAGTVALMLSVAPNLTPAQVQNILVTTAKPFRAGATCDTTSCGAGIVDAAAAVHAAAALAPPSNVVTVAEYYNATLDHYFITWIDAEQQNLDAGNTPTKWVRTGHAFRAYVAPQAGTSPVCRYYIPPALGDSHFFGRGTVECDATGRNHPSFVLEDPAFMPMILPAAGTCPAGTVPIYRVFSNRADANHRYMTDRGVRDMMVARGWVAEGDGPDLVVMCAPGN